jgi:hypothetical protein
VKLDGFIGPAYTLDSSNVDAQRCVNLYPEIIESGKGKEGQVAYLRGTPGLEKILEVGDGPIRLIHVDSIGRIFIVSGSQLYIAVNRDDWEIDVEPVAYASATAIDQDPGGDISDDEFTVTAHGYYTGLKVRTSSTINLPSALAINTDYWVIVTGANTFKLASSYANADAGTAVNLTDRGSGTMSVLPQIPAAPASIPTTSINTSSDELPSVAHALYTGLHVRLTIFGALPDGLDLGTDYYIIDSGDDVFKLAASIDDAFDGTDVDITAVSSDEWAVTLVGADGEDGGDLAPLSTSSGPVKAASMSFGGDGTDSSTMFVDGTNNYLFKDEAGTTTFTVLGEVDVAKAVFDIDDDITIYTTENVEDLVASGTFLISYAATGSGTPIYVTFYTDTDFPGYYYLHVRTPVEILDLTTAELVQYMTYGSVPGRTFDFNNPSMLPGDPNFVPASLSQFVASGGGSELMLSAFDGAGTQVSFVADTFSGAEFGSVPTATDIKWSDGFFILAEGGTNRFRVSDLQSFNLDALSFASAEGNPDIVLALEILSRDLYVFNEKTTEVYSNTGNADFPFERVQGGFLEVGCAAADSVTRVGTMICWLGRSEDGEGIVYAIEGLSPQRISTHAIEQAIRGYENISNASGYSYQSGGHTFYVLHFDEATWVFDTSTRLWHERAYSNAGTLERHRSQYCAFIPSQRVHIVSDYETNEIYTMDEDTNSDDGDEIIRLRAAPHLSSGTTRAFYSKLQLDMETGIGLDGGVQGSDPTVMLDWSDDGGHTWSSESYATADAGSGQIGDYRKRVIWRRLGSSRDRIFRVKITDPVKVRLIAAHIDVETGAS